MDCSELLYVYLRLSLIKVPTKMYQIGFLVVSFASSLIRVFTRPSRPTGAYGITRAGTPLSPSRQKYEHGEGLRYQES
jgi:hypothetical protein